MFNRKKIVIGETYIFDVLNETNMANLVSLVTVVKKIKHNKYTVVSVNNGHVFETKAKYLTPYVDPKKATLIRCQYGTPDFVKQDINYFELVDGMIKIIETALNENKENFGDCSEMLNDFNDVRKWGKELRDKIQKYVDISEYKDNMKILSNAYKNNNMDSSTTAKEPVSLVEKPIDRGDFKYYFDKLVSDYLNHVIDLDNFLWTGQEVIRYHYPKNYLINHGTISNEEVDYLVSDILGNIRNSNSIGFIIGMDDNDNWHIRIVYFTEDSDTMDMMRDFKKFVNGIYPELEKNGKCNPKYRFNVIAVQKRGDEEEEDTNE